MKTKKVKFIEVTSDQLKTVPLSDGTFFYTTDTDLFYRDTSTKRVLISGDKVSASVDSGTFYLSIGDFMNTGNS